MRLAINVVVFLTLSLLPSESQMQNITIGQWLEEKGHGNLTLNEIKNLLMPLPANRKDESAPAATQATEKKPTSSNQQSSPARTARKNAVQAKPSTQPTTRANTLKTTTKEGKPSTQSTTQGITKKTSIEDATASTQSTTQASTKKTTTEEARPSTQSTTQERAKKATSKETKPSTQSTTQANTKKTTTEETKPSTQSTTQASTKKTTAEIATPSTAKAPVAHDQSAPGRGNTTTENGNATTENGNTTKGNKSNPSKNQGDIFKWITDRTNFPVLFMVILVVIVAIYFGYHNRNKIRRFLGEGYGKAKQRGKGYLKVKVEDLEDIELPRDANRQYVY